MLRRRAVVSSSVGAALVAMPAYTTSVRMQSSGFNFKNSVNAKHLSTAKKAAEEAAAKAKSAAEEEANTQKRQQRERAPFMNKLNDLHSSGSGSSSSPSPSSSEATAATATEDSPSFVRSFTTKVANLRPSKLISNRSAALEKDRKTRLVWRDESSGGLDRFNWSDPLLFFKYARYGIEYAADTELERRLRYYKEHAAREMLTADGGKLMRGPPQLFPLRAPAADATSSSAAAGRGSTVGGGGVRSSLAGGSGGVAAGNQGIKNFIAASLAGHPNAPKKKGPGASASASSVEGIAATAADAAADPKAAGGEEASSTAAAVTAYFPTSNPATTATLRLPRIPTSHLGQFMPVAEGSSFAAPARVNGAYARQFLAVDSIAKESRAGVDAEASAAAGRKSPAVFLSKDSTQHVFNGSNFRRPAMIVISQLGIKLATEANNAWCCSALKYLEPNSPFITLFDDSCNTGNVYGRSMKNAASVTKSGDDATIRQTVLDERLRAQTQAAEEAGVSAADIIDVTDVANKRANKSSNNATGSTSAATTKAPAPPMKRPIDLYSLRSLDLYNYQFVHRMTVRRFADSLKSLDADLIAAAAPTSSGDASATSTPSPYLFGSVESIVANTFVGCGLLKNFFAEPFCLRNYIGTTVLLVDHHGRVRWVSGGKPDEQERLAVPRLLRDLEAEYLQALSGGRK